MKRTLICAALTLGMVALPVVSEAHGWEGRGGHGGYHRGGDFGRVVALPFLLGAAAIGAVATIATAPFNAVYDVPPPPPPPRVYYGGATTYYDAPPPPPTVYYGAPSYGYVTPPQTCTYYPNGSSYCR